MNPCRAILFDLGGVVINLSFERAYRRWAEISGLGVDEVRARFRIDREYELYEKGLWDTARYIDHVSAMVGRRFTLEEFRSAWNGIFTGTAHGIEQLLPRLHSRYRLLLLTNTNALHYEAWANQFDAILRHFDEIYCSFEIGARKPEPESFLFVLRSEGLSPAELVFLDDGVDNVEAARACGIRSALMADGQTAEGALLDMGIAV